MATYQVVVTDDNLEELMDIVAGIRSEQPGNPVNTEQKFVQGIVNNYFENRIRQLYLSYTKTQDRATLKSKFGTLKKIKKEMK